MPSPEEERLAPLAMQFLADNFDAMIEEMHTNYQKGEAFAVLDAISWSLMVNRPPPPWVGLEFLRCLNLSRELNSLDKVFGKPQGKGKHAGDFEKKNHWPALYRRVQELHTGDAPLDDELFGRAGKEFGMKKTAAKDLYYSLLPQYQRFCAAIGIDPLAPRNSGKF